MEQTSSRAEGDGEAIILAFKFCGFFYGCQLIPLHTNTRTIRGMLILQCYKKLERVLYLESYDSV